MSIFNELPQRVKAAPFRRPGRISGPASMVVAALIGSTALRLWDLSSPGLQIDGDQAVTGIMVNNILAGRNHYVFIAGQGYNGALEQWVQAAIYELLRLPRDPFTLRLPEVGWMALATWLVYLVGRRVLLRPWLAAFATVLFAVGPYWSFSKGNHSDGAYPSLLVVGLLAMYCALRLTADERRRTWWAAGFGACVGLTVWLGQTGIELLIPAALWAAPVFIRSRRVWLAAFGAALVGAAPTLLWSLGHGIFAPLDLGLNTVQTTLTQRVHNVFGPILREFIGVAGSDGAPGWPYWLQHVAVAGLAGALVVATIRRRRGLGAILMLRAEGERHPVDALLVSIPIMAIGYATSASAWDISSSHYLFVYTPVLVWCLAALTPPWRGWVCPLATVAAAGIFAASSLTFVMNQAATYPGTSDADLRATIAYLKAHDERNVYADFWTAMPVQYFAGQSLNVAPMAAGRGKFPATTHAVDIAPSVVYLDSPRNDSGRIVIARPPIKKQLTAFRVHFDEVHIGSVTVFSNIDPALRPWQLGLGPAPAVR